MADVMEFKCPNCSGALAFDIASQNLKCPFCGSEFNPEELKSMDEDLNEEKPIESEAAGSDAYGEELNWDTSAGGQWGAGETDGLNIYVCQSCGGEIVGDATLASSKCPYCDSTIVMKSQFSGDLKPDYVIPFKLDKEAAKKAFAEHMLGKKLVSKQFINENRIDEIKGVYVPYWLFDTDLDADVTYECTRSMSAREGDYIVTTTDYYDCNVEGSLGFENIPVDGSTKMANDMMESLEPFDFGEAVPFQTAYLAGYMADRYDVDLEASISSISRRVKGSAAQVFSDQVTGFNSKVIKHNHIRLKDNEAKYALYPIWLLKIKWDGRMYTFAMNGQTGKFVGDKLPEETGLAKKMTLIPTLIGAVAGLAIALINLL